MSHVDPMVESSHDPKNWGIYSLLSAWAERTPRAIAIAAPGRAPLTYGRLCLQLEDAVANLNAMGLGCNDRLALVLPQGLEMAVAFLAVAAGATCAPLNPSYRANEFDFFLADLHAQALMIQSGVDSPARAIAQVRGLPVIELSPVYEAEAGSFTLTGERRPRPTQSGFAQPGDAALVLHTSGTTARPKIVRLTHTNICTSSPGHTTGFRSSCLRGPSWGRPRWPRWPTRSSANRSRWLRQKMEAKYARRRAPKTRVSTPLLTTLSRSRQGPL
jgi:acyl-CoA synthetase (AMP-forming)/AMP-acid ligase II